MLSAFFASLLLHGIGQAAPAPMLKESPTACKGGMVVCVEPNAARVGAEVLRDGGNAVDAAVATGFALAVTHPEAGNIGGGGFMTIRLAKSGEAFSVDYRETAPALATDTMFLKPDGTVDREKAGIGWAVVGTPGSVHGLWTAHGKFGKLPWQRLVQPAIELCEQGFVVDKFLARGLKGQERYFRRYKAPAAAYYPDGDPPVEGSKLKLLDLARTLTSIRDAGADGFYKGRVAEIIDAEMKKHGGLVRKEDLAVYKAKIREPIKGSYRGHTIITAAPPAGGGPILVEMLNILEKFDLKQSGAGSPRTMHLLVEAMTRTYLDRARFLGDPDFTDIPLAKLLSKEYAGELAHRIGDRAAVAAAIGKDILTDPKADKKESEETTHYSVIDRDGNMVATTTTLEESYGSRVMAAGLGFLFNNEMHDFNVRPGVTDARGGVGTPPNLIAPGKRMLSSMTPTLVLKDDKPFLIVGSPGGRTIPNTTLQVILNVVDFGMGAQAAVDAGRIHHQWMPDVVNIEAKLPDSLVRELEALGHQTKPRQHQGDAHAILVDPATGAASPGVDHRLRGAAYGVD